MLRSRARLVLVAVTAVVALAGAACTTTVRVSTGANGEANNTSFSPAVDRTGRFVAFVSSATNLVAGDTNGQQDVFVRDTRNNVTTLVSRATNGTIGNGDSTEPRISANGQFVLFTSEANNLVAGDHNNASDVFLRDRHAHTTRLVSRATDGTVAHGTSTAAALSADGTKAVFSSDADDIVAGVSGVEVYLADLASNTVRRVSSPGLCPYREVHSAGLAVATSDASRVAYVLSCTNETDPDVDHPTVIMVVVRDVVAGTDKVVWAFAYTSHPFADGYYVTSTTFAGDGSRLAWVLVYVQGVHGRGFTPYQWSSGATTASVLPIADEATGVACSPDGALVAYSAPNPFYLNGLPHARVKLFDVATSQTYDVTVPIDGPIDDEHPNGDSFDPRFSGDGSQIVWYSSASDLVPGDTNHASDVFSRPVADVTGGSGSTRRVSG